MNDLKLKVTEFRDERGWGKFHNPKDLALSISLEASELLENFQWKSSEEAVSERLEEIKDELADVIIYSLSLADKLNIDIEQAVLDKLKKNEQKYPVEKSYGTSKKYTEL